MAYLLLETGEVFGGEAFAHLAETMGEVVLYTGMAGFQECVTDPDYHGKIVVMTYPLVGNYGARAADVESLTARAKAIVVQEVCAVPSNWLCEMPFEQFLKQEHIAGLQFVDTRALTQTLCQNGALRGIITQTPDEAALQKVKAFTPPKTVAETAAAEVHTHVQGMPKHIAVLDGGITNSLLSALKKNNCDCTIYPINTPAQDIVRDMPDGILVVAADDDPNRYMDVVQTVKALMQSGKPVMGIGTGALFVAMAAGATCVAFKNAHRGGSMPVVGMPGTKGYLTAQSHAYGIEQSNLPADIVVTYRNVNDKTIEGFALANQPVVGTLFHPEAHHGANEAAVVLQQFIGMLHSK